jgi:hypothetical protein
MPSAMDRLIACSCGSYRRPFRLMLATAGVPAAWSAVIQSMPAMTVPTEPRPSQSSTRTGTSSTFLATPKLAPPTVPATCVPCPRQSSAVPSLSTRSRPGRIRPANSVCARLMPPSMT